MAVIRGEVAASMLPDAIVLDLGDLARQGKAMMERAEAEAEAIVSQAKIERDRLIAGASEKGFEEGRAAGFAQGLEEGRHAGHTEAIEATRQEAQRVVRSWEEALEAFSGTREAMVGAAREDVVRFAVAFAERVTRRLVELDPSAVKATMEEALGLVMAGSTISVCVCPEDGAVAREVLGPILQRLGLSGDVELLEDASLGHGSCLVRTQAGSIDATIDAMIGRMVALLLPDGPGGRLEEAAPVAAPPSDSSDSTSSATGDRAHDEHNEGASDSSEADA